jgi:glycosyltransferase involved in cell wall biosynthesis
MERLRVAIVIPAFNEELTIGSVVEKLIKRASPLVIDDGSTDRTSKRAEASGALVLRHQKNQGYEAALNSGFAYAAKLNYEVIVTMDADGQHNPDALSDFLQEIESGADVVVGYRPKCQRLAEQIFAWYALRRWSLRDPLCGMKAYRTSVYRKLGHFDSYRSVGTELAIYGAKTGARISQVPVSISDRNGAPRFDRCFRANLRILRALLIGAIGSRYEDSRF